jgi:hypothetical protein
MEYVPKEYKRFKHPFTCKIAGPSGSGKTVLVKEILKNFKECIVYKDGAPEKLKVLWAYGEEGAVDFEQYPNVEVNYVDGLPSMDEINGCHLLIIDDLMSELANSSEIGNLFTRGRHLQISTIFIVQNALPQGRQMRNVNLNTHYLILFNNPSDGSQVDLLAGRLYTKHKNFFLAAFADATKRPFGYVRRDNTQSTPDKYRQTNIVPIDGSLVTTCYIPKNI